MAMNVKHLALEWLLANQLLIVPKHISLGLICRERTPWMVAVIHDPIVVTANTWSHGRTNVLAFACSLKNKLNGNATEELSPIIIDSVTVTIFSTQVTVARCPVAEHSMIAAHEQTSLAEVSS